MNKEINMFTHKDVDKDEWQKIDDVQKLIVETFAINNVQTEAGLSGLMSVIVGCYINHQVPFDEFIKCMTLCIENYKFAFENEGLI